MARRDTKCEEVQALLPAYVGEDEPYPHDLEVHLATCSECAAEDARYREVIRATGSLRFVTDPVPAGMVEAVMDRLVRADVVALGLLRRVAHDPRARYAAASIGGVMLGAATIAILWRRAARKAAAA